MPKRKADGSPAQISDYVLPLKCQAQNYAWGKKGKDSVVAQLAIEDLTGKEDKPYAELWMGTHPSGPSSVELSDGSQVLLVDYIKENPDVLGEKFSKKYASVEGLPFLFKVLSVQSALSIQAHPDKALAEKLHAEFPDVYKDDNHKPEMACALTEFEALCEFRPLTEIAHHLATVRELRALFGEADAVAFEEAIATDGDHKPALRALYTRLVKSLETDVSAQLDALVSRLGKKESLDELEKLVLRVHEQYPGDVGVFSLYFLNYITLHPGEAIFLAANLPHAYLFGDCMEIMATSDNVVRAGLTPKFKDVKTLTDMLTYEARKPEVWSGDSIDAYTVRYNVPIDEFQLERTTIPAGDSATVSSDIGPSILIVSEGSATIIATTEDVPIEGEIAAVRGTILFVSSDVKLKLTAGPNGVVAFRGSSGPL